MNNILFSYPSWEERAYISFKENVEYYKIHKAYIIRNVKSLNKEKTTFYLTKIEENCTNNNIDINFIDIESDGVVIWNTLKECVNNLSKDDNIILDITTMSRNIIWTLLFFFRESYPQITIVYYQPNNYSDTWISKEPETPRLLFKHSGLIELGLPTYLIIITGYDPERTRQVLGYYEPQKVFLVIQTGEQLNNHIKNTKELHISACENVGISNIEIAEIDSYNESFGLDNIEKIILEYKGRANFILTSLGPKLSAISAYQCYLKHPEIALSYLPCKEYNIDYCHGIGNKFSKKLNFKDYIIF